MRLAAHESETDEAEMTISMCQASGIFKIICFKPRSWIRVEIRVTNVKYPYNSGTDDHYKSFSCWLIFTSRLSPIPALEVLDSDSMSSVNTSHD